MVTPRTFTSRADETLMAGAGRSPECVNGPNATTLCRSQAERGSTLAIDFRVLGPLEVVDDGVPLRLGGPRARTLLAALLIETGRFVSRDRLIDELWADEPPATAENALQVQVAALRRLLPGRVETQRDGLPAGRDPRRDRCPSVRAGGEPRRIRRSSGSPRWPPPARAAPSPAGVAPRSTGVPPAGWPAPKPPASTRSAARPRSTRRRLPRARRRTRPSSPSCPESCLPAIPTDERLAGAADARPVPGAGAGVALATSTRVRDALERGARGDAGHRAPRAAAGDRAPRSNPRRPSRRASPRPSPASSAAQRELRETLALLGTLPAADAHRPGRLRQEPARPRARPSDGGDRLAEVHLVSLAALPPGGSVTRLIADGLDVRERRGEPLIAGILARLRNQRVPAGPRQLRARPANRSPACPPNSSRPRPGLRILATSREPLGAPGEVTWAVSGSRLPGRGGLAGGQPGGRGSMQLLLDRATAPRGRGSPVRPGGRERRRALPPARWPAARDRAGRRSAAHPVTRRDPRPPRRPTRPPRGPGRRHLGAPPDDARRDRLELRPARRRRAPPAPAAGRLPRRLDLCGAMAVWGDALPGADPFDLSAAWSTSRWSSPAGSEGPTALSPPGDDPPVRRGAAGRGRRGSRRRGRRHAAGARGSSRRARDWGGAEQETWLVRLGEAHADLLASLTWLLGDGRRPGRRPRDDGQPVVVLVRPRPRRRRPRLAAADPRGVARRRLPPALGGRPPRCVRPGAEQRRLRRGDPAPARRASRCAASSTTGRASRAPSTASRPRPLRWAGSTTPSATGRRAWTRSAASDNRRGLGASLTNLGTALRNQDRYDAADAALREADAVFRAVGDVRGETSAIINRAIVERRRGRLRSARASCVEALRLCVVLGHAEGEVDCLDVVAAIDVARAATPTDCACSRSSTPPGGGWASRSPRPTSGATATPRSRSRRATLDGRRSPRSKPPARPRHRDGRDRAPRRAA